MRLLPLIVVVSGQSWSNNDWSPSLAQTQASYSYGYSQSNPALVAANSVGCNSCTGQGCPSGFVCRYNSLAYNPQPCAGTCTTPADTSKYFTGTSYYDVTVDPYRLFNAYHAPVSSYNLPPDWKRCTSNTNCNSCVSVNGCAWSGSYCSIATTIQCTGGGCAYEPRQCPIATPGTCAGSTNCVTCTVNPGCSWSGSTCYLSASPCTNFGCANDPSQCHNTGGVVPEQCGPNEVWIACGSSNCHEDNCQDIFLNGDRVCQNDCWSGCQCAPGGFARNGDICVPQNQCASAQYGYGYGYLSSYASSYNYNFGR